jgi:calcineurin-like phosphoesterase family protein
MWVGLFSDIHANREAFEATLAHAKRAGISRFVFLGDYVGYGADPGFAVDTVMRESRAAPSPYSATMMMPSPTARVA